MIVRRGSSDDPAARRSRPGALWSATLAALTILAAGCSSSSHTTSYKPILPISMSVDTRAIPPGWVPIDLGYAQISVPATWQVNYGPAASDLACPAGAPGLLAVDEPWIVAIPFGACKGPGVGFPPPTTEVILGPIARDQSSSGTSSKINGVAVLKVAQPRALGSRTFRVVVLPDLDASVAISGPLGDEVLGTLSPSPRAVVLSLRTFPVRVARAWRWQTVEGLRFATPRTWPANSGDAVSDCDNWVALGSRYVMSDFVYKEPGDVGGWWVAHVLPDRPEVLIDSDQYQDRSCLWLTHGIERVRAGRRPPDRHAPKRPR